MGLLGNDPKHTSQIVAKWLNNKVEVFVCPLQSPEISQQKIWEEQKKQVEARSLQIRFCYTSSAQRNGPKF